MKKGRCTHCGEEIDVVEYEKTGICNKCNKAYITEKALRFIEVPDELAKEIKDLREKMHDEYKKTGDAENYAREIKDIISDDFIANYIFSVSKKKKNNQYFLNKFFLDANKEIATLDDIEYVVTDLINNLTMEDKYKILDFIKKVAITPVELMKWRDMLDEKIQELENLDDKKDTITIIYDEKDKKEYKKLKEALIISGYNVSEEKSILDIIITSNNSLNEEFKNKIKLLSNINSLEFKIDDFAHDVFFNQYLGIDEYVLVKDNFDDTLIDLIETVNTLVSLIKSNKQDEIDNVKKELKKSNEEYLKFQEEKKLREQERIKQEIENKKSEEKKRLEKEKRDKEEAARIARLEAERLAKEKEEAERLDRMESLILESYNSLKNIKQTDVTEKQEIEKQIDRIAKLIECDELLIALDSCLQLLEKYPKDYRVYFLYARLESENFKNILNETHVKYMEKALQLANSEEKQKMLQEYMPYSTLREKANVLSKLTYQLNQRVIDIPKAVKYCNDGIKHYKAKDVLGAIENWKISSELNNIEACYCLAVQYISGKYIEQDLQKAMKLLIKAANNNHERSILTLADAYERGLFGLEKDSDAACYYYRVLVERGNKEIIPTLNVMAQEYSKKGITDPNSKRISLKIYEILADTGDTEAMIKAANLHAYGIGSAYDRSKTVYYFKKAANLRNEQAMVKYAEIVKKGLYETKKDFDKYVEIISELADTYRDNLEYQKQYIELYEFGLYGVPKSNKMVLKIYEDLARINPDEEFYQLKLAEIYEIGLYGAVIDYKKMFYIYQNLVQKNPLNEAAQTKLAEIYEKGLYGVNKDLTKVGKIYGFLANKYPTNTTYLNKLAQLFMVSSGKNAFEIGMKFYQKSYDLGNFFAGCNLVFGLYSGDYNNQGRDYLRALEIANEIGSTYDPLNLSSDDEKLYYKVLQTILKIYYNGGYNVLKDEEKAKELLKIYNEKNPREKMKLKDLSN